MTASEPGKLQEAERWRRLEALFAAALDQPAAERATFISRQCGDDPQLVDELTALLAADGEAEPFLDQLVEEGAAALIERAEDWIGQHLGPYRIVRELGRGGMSTVYLAERDDAQYHRTVAIKLIRRGMDTDDMLQRFRSERQILASFEHPNIARLYDGGSTADGRPYFVMEVIDGEPIDRYCDRHALSVEARLELFRQVCAAVHHAHRNLVVHRDLKPSNILVTAYGSPKLLDFGIAKWLRTGLAEGIAAHTRPAERPMTLRYASPEQVAGRPITTASDIYSLGVLLYELLTGRNPHPATSLASRRAAPAPIPPSAAVLRPSAVGEGDEQTVVEPRDIARRRGTDPESLRRALVGDLDDILLMALREEPDRRYGSVEQFSEDLGRYLTGHPVLAQGDTWHYRAAKFIKRHRLGVGAATTILIVILALIVTLWVQSTRITHERDRAQRVLSLVIDVFEIADPGEVRGNTITARELLDRSAARVAELADEPDTAVLLDTLARLYEELGLYPSALPLRRRGLEISGRVLGDLHPDTVEATAKLARCLALSGDFTTAERFFARALADRRRLHGDDDPRTLRDLNGLALTLHDLGDYSRAAQLYEQGAAIFERLDEEARATAFLPSNIALLHYDMGDFAQAEERYRETLRLRQKILGQEHPLVADVFDALGMTLAAQGRHQEAERLLRRGHDLRLRLLGEQHRDIARSRTHLGRLLVSTGRLEEGGRLLEQAFEQRRSLIGEHHPEIAATLEGLASWRARRGELAAAEKLYRQALTIYEESLPRGHPLSVDSRLELAFLLAEQGRDQEAEPLLREALEIRRQTFPPDSWQVAEARNALDACLARLGQEQRSSSKEHLQLD